MVMKPKANRRLVVLAVAALIVGCGKKSSSDTSDDDDDDDKGGNPDALSLSVSEVAPTFSLVSPVGAQDSSASLVEDEGEAFDTEDPRKAREAVKNLEDATEIKDCLGGFARKRRNNRSASCYGPDVWVSDYHPDGNWTGDMQHALPQGDLGFMEAEEESGEACAAAKMNSVVAGVREQATEGLELAQRAACFARVLGKELPTEEGDSLSLADEVNEALAEKADGMLEFTKIEITLESVDGDVKVYKTDLEAAGPRGAIWTRVVQKRTSDTEAEGYVWGVFTPDDDGAKLNNALPGNHAFSVLFKESGDDLTYDATKSRVEDSEIEEDKTAVFEDDLRVRVAESGNLGYDHMMTTVNLETLAGYTIAMWTAGSSSEQQRVMHVKVTGEGDERVGTGYFGFGATLADHRAAVVAGEFTDGATSIEKMICNWAGPASDKTGSDVVQKQVLAMNPDTGFFEATSSNIGYAARNDCGASGADANFKYVLKTSDTRPADADFDTWPAFDLVDLADEAETLELPALLSISL